MIGALAVSLLPLVGPGPHIEMQSDALVHRVQLAPRSPSAPRNPSPRRVVRSTSPTVKTAPAAAAPAPAPAAPATAPSSGPYKEQYTWFWKTISAEYTAANPSRLALAEALVAAPPEGVATVRSPQAATLARIAKDNNAALQAGYKNFNVSPAYALAVIWAESAGKTGAVSRAGAGGLMQLMPATANRFDVTDRFNPSQNIRGGMEYLFVLLSLFSKDPLLALAGYNAGEGAVLRYDGVPPFAETRDYVPKVIAAWSVAKTLCTTTPAKVTDACVFK